jgi:hypothetical protein
MARRQFAKLLMTTVAHRYFISRHTKLEIAENLGISRFKVARLIEEAIESGAIRFVITDQKDYDTALAETLAQRYQLRHAVVVRGPSLSPTGVTEALGRAAAVLLEETLADSQTLAVAWGRTLAACAGGRNPYLHQKPRRSIGRCRHLLSRRRRRSCWSSATRSWSCIAAGAPGDIMPWPTARHSVASPLNPRQGATSR